MSRRDCPSTGKTGYRSRTEAKRGATAVARRGERRMRTYLCPDCAHWHLASEARR